jgi:DNA-directed RNA polymerase subunit RPC12/RpoP
MKHCPRCKHDIMAIDDYWDVYCPNCGYIKT